MKQLEKPLNSLLERVKGKSVKRIAVAAAEDKAVLLSIREAVKTGIIEPVLVGNKSKIEAIFKEINFSGNKIRIVDESNPSVSAEKAVELIKKGEAEILMKGFVGTGPLLKAVLDKEKGLKKSGTLSHFALFDVPSYPKLLGITDAAMNISPDFNEKTEILLNAVDIMHRLGLEVPKVAIISPVEVVNPKIESTVHAAMLSMMQKRGQIKGCLIDGPLALDNAISKEAAEHKGIQSEVAGDADLLLAPDLDAGNMLYKSLIFFAGGITAAIITGASAPIVLTSDRTVRRASICR
ncbi:MAG: bifunctional enoyl-CoA hydratase/phosphate acetyltransferase [Bacteroidales bacterium]